MKTRYALILLCCIFIGGTLSPAWGYDGVDFAAVKKQADAGDPDAQSKLGVLYASGLGVKQDLKEAARWYKKAADQSYPLGMWNLAFLYVRGEGVPKVDYVKALGLFRNAAELGLDRAQYDLGMMYLNGLGTEENSKEAEKWFHRAADQGNREAVKILKEIEEAKKKEGTEKASK